ncbi:MAG: hypothetical protein NTX50_22670, partial [Candidatus Sumerlaeota bacterium]|nr:hypothetical protein [Candidatus Sumerlaeota bacterium]
MSAFLNKPALGPKDSPFASNDRTTGLWKLWPYLLLFLLFFHPILMGGLFAGGDLINHYLPWKELWRQYVWAGDWPLWNPMLFCGMPFQANIQSGQFYPPNWLFLLLPGAACYTIVTLLHWIWGVWGMTRLAGRLSESRGARFAAAAVFFFSGFFLSRMPSGVVLFLFAAAWMPWILDALIDLTNAPKIKVVLRLAIFLALQLLAGAPQISFYTLIAAALWIPFGIRSRKAGAAARGALIGRAEPIRKGYGNRVRLGFMAALALFIALALVQIWPTRDFVRDSFARSRGARWEFVIDGSMSWRYALTQVFPFIFYQPLDERYYWASAPRAGGEASDAAGQHATGFHEINVYSGWMAYLLGLLAFMAARRWALGRDRKEPYPVNLALIKYSQFLIVFSAILSFGGNSYVFKFFFDHVPGFNLFRDPARV